MPLFNRTPEKYEARALEYERRGKTNKAIKNREKAAKLRLKHGGTVGATPLGVPVSSRTTTTTTVPVVTTVPATVVSTGVPVAASGYGSVGTGIPIGTSTTTSYTTRTPALYEQNALKWEQRGNYAKAQKNREKVWRLQNPNYGPNVPAPVFYQNNAFVGYGVPVTNTIPAYASRGGLATGLNTGAPSAFQRQSFWNQPNRNFQAYELRAAEYERLGKAKKAARYRQKAQMLQGNGGLYQSRRTVTDYEQRALKWEQRGNWQKAQKNREKAWRLQNPQYLSRDWSAPTFYNNNTTFLGYQHFANFQPVQLTKSFNYTQYGAPIVHTTTVAPTVETHMHSTVVEQTTRMEKVTEIQPVIHREIVAPEVRVIEQHVYESVPSTGPSTITKQAIVEETIKPRIIEEIQPVVHREVPQTFVEHVQQHVTEHIARPTIETREVINTQNQFSTMSLGGGLPFGQTQAGFTSLSRFSQFGRPNRDIGLYEAKLREYERTGNTKKAMRLREKMQHIQHGQGGYTSHQTPQSYEAKALKWEQRGNWAKAQKSREKAWRLQNPQYMDFNQYPSPSFYNNNQFLGYNQPLPQFQAGQAFGQQFPGQSSYRPNQFSQFGLTRRDPALYLSKAAQYEQRGNAKKAQRLREKAAKIRQNNGQYRSARTPAIYEQQAAKWEARGNWDKAQKNREKAWRLQNPQYMNRSNFPAPSFYQNNKFSGYNVPYPFGGAGLNQQAHLGSGAGVGVNQNAALRV